MEYKKKGRRVLNVIFALILAVAMWLYVINVENPTGIAHLRGLDVVLQGQSQLEERNLMVTGLSQEQIDLRVTGRKKTLMKLGSKNVSLLLDVSGIEEAGEWPLNCRLSLPGNVNTDNVTLADWEDLQVMVTVQEIASKEVPVQGEFVGTTQTGYLSGKVTTDVETVYITGPAQTLEEISCALAQIGGESISKTLREEASLVLASSNGDAVDGKGIRCSENTVNVVVPVEKVSTIPLTVELQDSISTRRELRWSIEPESIAVVEEAEGEVPRALSLGTLSLSGIYGDTVCYLPIHSPEGYQGWNVPAYAKVELSSSRIQSRQMVLEDITFKNVPAGYHVELLHPTIYIWVWGATRQISALEEDRLSAVVDLSQAKRGTDAIQRLPVEISIRGAYNYVNVLGGHYTVAVRLDK